MQCYKSYSVGSAPLRSAPLRPERKFFFLSPGAAFGVIKSFGNCTNGVNKIKPRKSMHTNTARRTQPVRDMLTDYEYLRLLEAAPNWIKPIIELLDSTGLRIGEVVGSYEKRKGKITIRRGITAGDCVNVGKISTIKNRVQIVGKGDKLRTVPLNMRARRAIRILYQKNCPGGDLNYLLVPVSRQYVSRGLRETARLIGIEKPVNPHQFRHRFATRLVRTGRLREAQDILGHSDMRLLSRYAHPGLDDLISAVDAVS
jgi:site-specific recombinase XerD